MKNSLRFLAATLAILAGASAFAQDTGTTPPPHGPHFGPPPGVVNDDGTITLPDGTVLPAPTFNDDGTITLPDGTVIDPSQMPPPHRQPPVKNADGSITLPDGTVIQPNADGTYTLPDGHVIDLTKAPPAGGPGPGRGHRGPPPSGG
jgi:hypothetical protein